MFGSFFRVTVLSLLSAGSCFLAYASEPQDQSVRLTPHDKLYDVYFSDELRGWSVGTRGLILHTDDAGRTWQKQMSGTEETLFGISFSNQRGWISGSGGVVLLTVNGGQSWALQRGGTTASLFSIQFVSETAGFAVGSFGTALRSENGGLNWESLNLNWRVYLRELIEKKGQMEPHLYDINFVNADLGWIVGEFGLVLHTSDGGKSWKRQTVPVEKALFRVFFTDENRGWITGQNGILLMTDDQGRHWRSLDAGSQESLFNLVIQGRRGLIVGERGTILTSEDGGITWRAKEDDRLQVTSWLGGVSSAGKNRFVVVGDRGALHFVK